MATQAEQAKAALDELDAAAMKLEEILGEKLPWLRFALSDARADVRGILEQRTGE